MNKCVIRQNIQCGIGGCTNYEHPLIHPDNTTKNIHFTDWNEASYGSLDWDVNTGDSIQLHSTVMKLAGPGAISVQTIVCFLSGNKLRTGKKIIAMLDSGSNTTCIDEETAIQLKLRHRSKPSKMVVNLIDGPTQIESFKVDVHLTSCDGLTAQDFTAHTVKDLTKNTSVVDWSKCKQNFDHLKDIPFDTLPHGERISILIGSDNAFLFSAVDGTKREGPRGEPIAYKTSLGWTCLGPTTKPKPEESNDVYSTLTSRLPKTK
jgi:hypothetical protein